MFSACRTEKQRRTGCAAVQIIFIAYGNTAQFPPDGLSTAPAAIRHGICVAKMLDNTQSIICAFGLAAAVPRSPYRHLELCSIALKRCVSGFAGWRAESFPRTVLPRHRPKSSMRQTGADSPAPSQTVHWTVCVPLWRERAVRIPSLREKQKALSPDGERAFCGRSDGIRTHGLLVPNQARYQLRYTPKKNPQQLCCCGGWG